MAEAASSRPRVCVDGKFFRVGEKKFYVKGVAYGPFAPDGQGSRFASPEQTAADFAQIRTLNANIVRVYHVPPRWLLDLALEHKLKLLIDITSKLAQTFDLDSLLPKIVDILFQLFKQADRGFIILKEEGTDNKLIPKVIKTRRAFDETNARFSRSIVNRCIQTNQAPHIMPVLTSMQRTQLGSR